MYDVIEYDALARALTEINGHSAWSDCERTHIAFMKVCELLWGSSSTTKKLMILNACDSVQDMFLCSLQFITGKCVRGIPGGLIRQLPFLALQGQFGCTSVNPTFPEIRLLSNALFIFSRA